MLGGSFVGSSSPRSVGFSRGIQPWLSSAANLWRQVPEGLRRKLQLCQPHRLQAHRQSPPLQPLWQPARNLAQQTNKQNKQTNQQTKKQTNKQTHIQFNIEDWYTQPFDPGFFRLPSMPPAAMFLGQPRTDLVPESPDIVNFFESPMQSLVDGVVLCPVAALGTNSTRLPLPTMGRSGKGGA